MITYNLILYFFVITFTFLENQVFTLKQETILGGYPSLDNRFSYQVAILGLSNYTVDYHVICGGGIISETLVLSAAQCFVTNSNVRIELRYSVAAGTTDIQSKIGIRVDVKQIYIPNMPGGLSVNDIAIVELEFVLGLKRNNLYKLALPDYKDNFEGRIGVIAGYGFKWVFTGFNSSKNFVRIDGFSDDKLTYGLVHILSNHVCKELLKNFISYKQLCGIMRPRAPMTKTGICSGDAGGPLIIDGRMVGIASRNSIDCDDRIIPCRFTKTAPFAALTDYVSHGQSPSRLSILPNLQHVLDKQLTNFLSL